MPQLSFSYISFLGGVVDKHHVATGEVPGPHEFQTELLLYALKQRLLAIAEYHGIDDEAIFVNQVQIHESGNEGGADQPDILSGQFFLAPRLPLRCFCRLFEHSIPPLHPESWSKRSLAAG
jgi:hypothetical protein